MKMRVFPIEVEIKIYAQPLAFNFAFDLSDGFILVQDFHILLSNEFE